MIDRAFVPQFEIPHIKLVREFDRLFNQRRFSLGRVCNNPSGIEVGQADQKSAKQPTTDKHQRQNTDKLRPVEDLQTDSFVLQPATENSRPFRALIEAFVAACREILVPGLWSRSEFDLRFPLDRDLLNGGRFDDWLCQRRRRAFPRGA